MSAARSAALAAILRVVGYSTGTSRNSALSRSRPSSYGSGRMPGSPADGDSTAIRLPGSGLAGYAAASMTSIVTGRRCSSWRPNGSPGRQRPVLRVGNLDVVARDPQQVEDRVQVRDADRRVGGVPDGRLGVERDPEPGRRDHVQIVRPVAYRHGLAERDVRPGGEL